MNVPLKKEEVWRRAGCSERELDRWIQEEHLIIGPRRVPGSRSRSWTDDHIRQASVIVDTLASGGDLEDAAMSLIFTGYVPDACWIRRALRAHVARSFTWATGRSARHLIETISPKRATERAKRNHRPSRPERLLLDAPKRVVALDETDTDVRETDLTFFSFRRMWEALAPVAEGGVTDDEIAKAITEARRIAHNRHREIATTAQQFLPSGMASLLCGFRYAGQVSLVQAFVPRIAVGLLIHIEPTEWSALLSYAPPTLQGLARPTVYAP